MIVKHPVLVGMVFLCATALSFQSEGAADNPNPSKLDALETSYMYSPPAGGPIEGQTNSVLSEAVIKSKIFNELFEAGLVTVVALAGLLIALKHLRGENMVQAIGLVLVVFGTVFLALVSEVSAQLSAATGVLGSVAGYIFGRSHRREEDATQGPNPSTTAGANERAGPAGSINRTQRTAMTTSEDDALDINKGIAIPHAGASNLAFDGIDIREQTADSQC